MKPPVFSCLAAHTTDNGSFYGRFLFGPLPVDISLTLATILRRSLLHNKAPFVIISAEIEGATHEYAALPGIQESVLEILLNLGEIVLTGKKGNLLNPNTYKSSHSNQHLSNTEISVASLKISGPCIVTAKDIYWPDGIYCVKPNAHIATLSSNNTLGLRIKILSSVNTQTSLFEKPHLDLFSKHLRSISTLSFAASGTVKDNQPVRLGRGSKKFSEKQSSKRKTTFGFLGGQLDIPLLKSTKILFKKGIRDKKSSPLIKKPGVYCSLKQSPALETKVAKQYPNGSVSRLRHYPFLDFNLTSMDIVPDILGAQNANSGKEIIKGSDEILEKRVSKNILHTRKKQLLDLFYGQPNGAFSLSLILQHLSGSLKKQAIKHLSFTQLFEYRLSKIKQSKEEPKSSEPWGNELAVTSSFYPIEKVNFVIERDDQLVGHRHRIILEVWTNGSISPRQAIFDSINWVMKLVYSFREPIAPFERNS